VDTALKKKKKKKKNTMAATAAGPVLVPTNPLRFSGRWQTGQFLPKRQVTLFIILYSIFANYSGFVILFKPQI
jgi:hypothetical protein